MVLHQEAGSQAHAEISYTISAMVDLFGVFFVCVGVGVLFHIFLMNVFLMKY